MNLENYWNLDEETKKHFKPLESMTVVELAIGMASQVEKCTEPGEIMERLKTLEFSVLVFELVQHIKTAIRNGAPVNPDGTVNIFKLIEWTEKITNQGKNH